MTDAEVRFVARRIDWRRHVDDLQTNHYEGATTREDRELVFTAAFDLTTPVAVRVLQSLAASYLGTKARVSVAVPQRVSAEELPGANRTPTGGLLGSWSLSWPTLEEARSRLTGEPMPPVQIFAMFPDDFTHPHLALFDIDPPRRWVACWPFQVTSAADAERQEPTLAAIAEADMHERTFASDLNWRLLQISPDVAGVAMQNPMRIWTLGAKVADLDAEIDFIERIGGELVLDDRITFSGTDFRVPLLRFGDRYLHIASRMVYEDALGAPLDFGLCHVVFEVDDLVAARGRALAAGASEVTPAAWVEAGFGVRNVAFLRSPGGILFELVQIVEHRVPRP